MKAGSESEPACIYGAILMVRIALYPRCSTDVTAAQANPPNPTCCLYCCALCCCVQVRVNEEVGHLVRTKTSSSNEGGVAAGFAVLDSPLLASPGQGLLHPQLEAGAGSGAQHSSCSSSSSAWGANGGVLAVAKALLQ